MSDGGLIAVLFVVGVIVLFAELLLPSFGLLTVIALGCFLGGVILTFQSFGQTAGVIATVLCAVGLPVGGAIAMRIWPRTRLGKLVIPPNPILTDEDTSIPVAELNGFVGKTGRATSTLRPVGVCEFDGQRISCVAESGLVDLGAVVEGVGVSGGNVVVQAKRA